MLFKLVWDVRLPVRTALLQNLCVNVADLRTVRLPVRTALLQNYQSHHHLDYKCDYQSERHCSKTDTIDYQLTLSAITSQNGTAPKPHVALKGWTGCAITSQNGTAPKPHPVVLCVHRCAITSQNGTAPKPWRP